ncbi:hypothetical protein WDU94_003697, partial [Cyamophila willieti]
MQGKWEDKYSVDRLSRDELVYELKIARQRPIDEKNETVESLRSNLRIILKEPVVHDIKLQFYRIQADKEHKIIQEGIKVLEARLIDCDRYGSKKWADLATKFAHLECRLQRTRLRDGENEKGFNESILNLQTQLNTIRAAIEKKYIKLYEEHCKELEQHRQGEEAKANQDGTQEPSIQKLPPTNKPPPPPSPKNPERRPSNPQISEEQQIASRAAAESASNIIEPARMNISQTNEQQDQIIRQGIMDRPPQVVLTSTNGITTQAVSTVKMPTINPPSFDGTGDIEEFLKGYNLAATLNNWGAELKAQCLPIHIKGPAKTFYENSIEGKDTPWGGIEALLRRRFTPMGK